MKKFDKLKLIALLLSCVSCMTSVSCGNVEEENVTQVVSEYIEPNSNDAYKIMIDIANNYDDTKQLSQIVLFNDSEAIRDIKNITPSFSLYEDFETKPAAIYLSQIIDRLDEKNSVLMSIYETRLMLQDKLLCSREITNYEVGKDSISVTDSYLDLATGKRYLKDDGEDIELEIGGEDELSTEKFIDNNAIAGISIGNIDEIGDSLIDKITYNLIQDDKKSDNHHNNIVFGTTKYRYIYKLINSSIDVRGVDGETEIPILVKYDSTRMIYDIFLDITCILDKSQFRNAHKGATNPVLIMEALVSKSQ